MNEGVRLFAALATAGVLTCVGHWLSGYLDYPLGWGWCLLIGVVLAAVLWYGFALWDLLCEAAWALTDWWR